MSLFGGEDSSTSQSSPSPSQESDRDSPINTAPAASSWPDGETSQDAQPLPYTVDADDEANEDDESSDAESEPGPEEESARPNRFTGSRQTWWGYTIADRQVAAALEQAQAGDLAAHLYNAHALKRRARLPPDQLAGFKDWQSKEQWLRKGDALRFVDAMGEVQKELVPLKRWTAWPLQPAFIPGSGERFGRQGPKGEEGGWYSGGLGEPDFGDELREEMLALMLRLAKEQYRRREDVTLDTTEEQRDRSVSRSKSRPRSRSTSVRSRPSPSAKDDTEGDESDVEMQESVKGDDDNLESGHESAGKQEKLTSRGRRRTPELPFLKPTILTDDDKARQILRPTINSLLSRLDVLASGIRRTRQNHFGRGPGSDTSGSEGMSDIGLSSPGSRSQSRSRSMSVRSKTKSRASSRAASAAQSRLSSRSRKKSRKRPIPDPIDSESASDYGAEHEREERARSKNSDSPPRKRARSKSNSSSDSKNSFRSKRASRQAGLMDWSEVLGIASMVGWNERAIARTAQRCATLFGEGMSFRLFDEGLGTKPVSEPVHYNPTTIPSPDIFGVQDPSAQETKRPFFQKGTLSCPHTDCPSHERKFEFSYRVIEHVKRIHGYDPRTNDSDNEDGRMIGGVHRDGFLLPIYAQQGWLGGGRAKSESEKRVKKEKGKGKEREEGTSGDEKAIMVETSPVEDES